MRLPQRRRTDRLRHRTCDADRELVLRLAILANGPSLATHDLSQIRVPACGLNRSWKVYENPAFHVSLEFTHYTAAPEYHARLASQGKLYTAVGPRSEVPWPKGTHRLEFGSGKFSKDVFAEGVVTEMHGVGSVFWAALQVAYTKGYREVFALGLDLMGAHFDGSPASPNVWKQNLMFAHVPPDMSVFTCGSKDSLAIFPKVAFDAICS